MERYWLGGLEHDAELALPAPVFGPSRTGRVAPSTPQRAAHPDGELAMVRALATDMLGSAVEPARGQWW